uniref:AAA family ATPase n=1 Tax=Fulvivirga sp. TaxID=1931237 RepID=UPI00404ACF47
MVNKLAINIAGAGYGENKFYSPLSAEYVGNQCIVLVGPGGSGKTTLLRLLSQTEHESLWLDGHIQSSQILPFYLLQNYPQDFKIKFSSHDLELIETFWDHNKTIIQALSEFNTKELSEWPSKFRKIGLFSFFMLTEQFQKSGILIFDEPESGLDFEIIELLASKINQLKKDRIIVISTHHVAFMELVADQIIFLKYGEVISKTSKDDFFSSEDDRITYLIKMGC